MTSGALAVSACPAGTLEGVGGGEDNAWPPSAVLGKVVEDNLPAPRSADIVLVRLLRNVMFDDGPVMNCQRYVS